MVFMFKSDLPQSYRKNEKNNKAMWLLVKEKLLVCTFGPDMVIVILRLICFFVFLLHFMNSTIHVLEVLHVIPGNLSKDFFL